MLRKIIGTNFKTDERRFATDEELPLYFTEVSVKYGDKLISLSACEYSRNNGRLVVAKKISD